MYTEYIHFGSIKMAVRTTTLIASLLQSVSAHAQLITLGDVISNLNVLNAQVVTQASNLAALDVDVDLLTVQTTANTASIAQLNYDLTVVNAQIAANGTVVTALNGRIGVVEAALPALAGRLTTLETSAAAQVAATTANTSAIAANAAVGTANTAALVANTLRDDAQDVSIAANAAVGTTNTAAIAVNLAAIAANTVRDDSQDTSIAVNTSAIAANTGAISVLDGRVTAHDVILAQHTSGIAVATQTAVAAQTATATLRSDVVAGRIGLVQQDATGLITVGAQTGGTTVSIAGTAGDRRVSGVAAGVASNDAATMGQVAQSQTQAVGQANTYTDQRIANYVNSFDGRTETLIAQNNMVLRREMNAAAASSAAISSLPHSINPGEGMGAVAIGGRGDAVAFAIGVSKAFKTDHTPIVRAGAALDARTGTLTYNAAVGVHF